MCYRVFREPDRKLDHVTQLPLPPERQTFLRPRIVGAVAAALVALVATAAMLLPSSTPAVSSEQAGAAATTVSRLDADARSGPVVEQTATTMDDGVPSATDVATVRSSAGHCDHGL
jgi:hypothetical protein